MYAVAAVGIAAGLLWLGGAVSAVLSGHRVPPGRPLAGLAALAHPGDPRLAWRAPVGSPVVYWTVTVLVWSVAGGLVWALRRIWHGHGPAAPPGGTQTPHGLEGLASRRQVKSAAGSKTLVARAAVLRPSVSHPAPGDVGFPLGRSRGVSCWAGVRDSTVLLGPPGAGKGLHLVIPTILDVSRPGDHHRHPPRQPGCHLGRPVGARAGGGVRPPAPRPGRAVGHALVADPGL